MKTEMTPFGESGSVEHGSIRIALVGGRNYRIGTTHSFNTNAVVIEAADIDDLIIALHKVRPWWTRIFKS